MQARVSVTVPAQGASDFTLYRHDCIRLLLNECGDMHIESLGELLLLTRVAEVLCGEASNRNRARSA